MHACHFAHAIPSHLLQYTALTIRDCKELVDEGIIAGGMIPKVRPPSGWNGWGRMCAGWRLGPQQAALLVGSGMSRQPQQAARPKAAHRLFVGSAWLCKWHAHSCCAGGLLHPLAEPGRQRDAHH